MIPYYGDYPEDHAEIRIPFNTFDSNDPSASVTITNLADGDIEVHADGDTTQIATDGASVIINFAGETGSHMILIDSSVDAAYTTATEYAVKIVGTTIDGATVNAWIGTFSIERAGGALATALLTNTVVDGIAAKLVGITLLNEWLGIIAGKQNADATALTEIKASGAGSGTYDPNTDSTEALRDLIGAAGAGLTDLGGMSTGMKGEVESEANDALVAQKLDHLVAVADADDVVNNSIIARLADSGATADWSAFVQTTDSLRALRDRGDAAWVTATGFALASVLGALTDAAAAGEVTTADTLMQYLKQIVNLLAGGPGIATNPSAAVPANAVNVFEILNSLSDRLPTALASGNIKSDMLAISGDATAADRLEALMDGIIVAQVNDGSATTTVFIGDGFTEATADHMNGRLITFISGVLSGQQTDITDYSATTQSFTVTALTEAPANETFFVIH